MTAAEYLAEQTAKQAKPKKPTRHSLLIQDAAATYAPEAHRPGTQVWASSLGIFLGTTAEYGEPVKLYHYCWKVGGWKTARYATEAAALKAASLEQWEQRP
jgi:hypothetical protein